jgi:hypothetical protein
MRIRSLKECASVFDRVRDGNRRRAQRELGVAVQQTSDGAIVVRRDWP